MSFVTPAPYTYLAGNSAYPSSGLVALYNIANPSCYTSGSSTIYDLSGQGNTLAISASSVTYIAASSSLQFDTKATTSSYGQIKSNNQLIYNGTYPLHTTSSKFTIVNFVQSISEGDYQPLWYIGNTTNGAVYKQIMNADWPPYQPYKIGIGSQVRPTLINDYFNPYYNSGGGSIYSWGSTTGSPTYGSRKWSMQSYAKSSQINEFNLNIAMRGYNAGSTWDNSSLAVLTLSTGSYPRVNGGDAQTTYQTNLDDSYLYIGKTPAIQAIQGILPTYQFGGMAIYNRPLTTDEINKLWTYFINGRTP